MLARLRAFIKENQIDAMLVNSTNEYLVEYNTLEENARYQITGFSGSTGDAVITLDKVYLFVDGRYHIQADNEVNHNIVTVIKLQNGETFNSKLAEIIPKNSILGVNASKNSQFRIEQLKKLFTIKLLDTDLLTPQINLTSEQIEQLDINLTGKSKEQKINDIRTFLNDNDAILVTNLEDVSYLFNLRDFSKPYSSKIEKRAIITKNNAELFSRNEYEKYKNKLLSIEGKIFIDKKTINARDYNLIKDKAIEIEPQKLQFLKSIKTDGEISHYIKCFEQTDKAVKAIREYIKNNENISEYDIDTQLEKEFKNFGAKSLSFKSIVAKDKNSASAHYSKSSRNEIIKNGSLILIDCGAYYDGGLATDITRVFVKGEPTELQKQVYTTVLKAFLNAFNTEITPNLSGYDIDAKVRNLFKENPIEGFVFNHGLGHGIGISVHEYPPNLSCNELAKIPLKENMCFTIEPGLYNQNHFGIRLENSCYLKNGKINSFVKMNYEKKLINYSLLSDQEKEWLKEFEVI